MTKKCCSRENTQDKSNHNEENILDESNEKDYYTDMNCPTPNNPIYDEVETGKEQRDVVLRSNPYKKIIIFRTEV